MINERKVIDFSSLPAAIRSMIELDSNAAAVIDELIAYKGENTTLVALILLDDMNIRGVQIYDLYKLANKNIEEFYDKILNITKKDIEKLNTSSASLCAYKAVFSGNTKERQKNPEKYLLKAEEREKYTKISKQEKENLPKDFYPAITVSQALELIDNNKFTLGYQQTYKKNNGEKETYRVFYNEFGDVIYTHSLDEENIFLWGQSKLNVVRKIEKVETKFNPCNAYFNVPNVVGYNIELKEKPLETYKKILSKKEKPIENLQEEYYDNNLIPIIETTKSMKYKEDYPSYKACVIASIYDLLTFKETYKKLDEGLKKLYEPLLDYASDKAYDEIISHLNSDEGIEIAIDLQNILGISLDKIKLFAAKDRYCQNHGHDIIIPVNRFLSRLICDDPWAKDMNARIIKILAHDIKPVYSKTKEAI